jgi:heme/copper-type cytochrome/quinol oxidase subunit 4
METKDYAILFVLDVIATVVAIFVYIGIGGSF